MYILFVVIQKFSSQFYFAQTEHIMVYIVGNSVNRLQ